MTNNKWWNNFFKDSFASFFLERDEPAKKVVADFIISKLHLKKGMTVFDQCCGTGDISLALGERGMKTIGVEQSEEYVQVAKAKAGSTNAPCKFYAGDALCFIPKEKCDAVINWYTSFGYSRDDRENIKMIKCAYKTLKKGGYFAIEYYYNVANILKNFRPALHTERVIQDEKFEITKYSTIDLVSGMMISNWEYQYPNGPIKRSGGETRLYMPYDFKLMLVSTGFKDIQFYGDMSGSHLELDSPRCIIVGRKL